MAESNGGILPMAAAAAQAGMDPGEWALTPEGMGHARALENHHLAQMGENIGGHGFHGEEPVGPSAQDLAE